MVFEMGGGVDAMFDDGGPREVVSNGRQCVPVGGRWLVEVEADSRSKKRLVDSVSEDGPPKKRPWLCLWSKGGQRRSWSGRVPTKAVVSSGQGDRVRSTCRTNVADQRHKQAESNRPEELGGAFWAGRVVARPGAAKSRDLERRGVGQQRREQ